VLGLVDVDGVAVATFSVVGRCLEFRTRSSLDTVVDAVNGTLVEVLVEAPFAEPSPHIPLSPY
jgi:hypothetical protein